MLATLLANQQSKYYSILEEAAVLPFPEDGKVFTQMFE